MDESRTPVRRSRSPSMGVTSLQPIKTTGIIRDIPGGILRVDVNKPRRSSGSSVEFRDLQAEPSSPQPSVDRLSVSFAPELGGGGCSISVAGSDRSDSSLRVLRGLSPHHTMEKSRLTQRHESEILDDGGVEDDDYSASVNAIIQRRNSTRRHSKRRKTSFSPDGESAQSNQGPRRRSSVFTTSSAETGASFEDGSGATQTQEQIFERLRIHKEVLQSARHQAWPMRRKMRLVRQAKGYVRKHEGELQERLAHSRTTRDMAARANILILKFWRHLRRELANLINYIIPWESRIKEIESHFGSAVASYFTFLRWLFWVNLVITILLSTFVAVPEVLASEKEDVMDDRKSMLPEERANATDLATLWDFEGVLRYSPMFYGYYSNKDKQASGYRLPFAYFMTSLAVYVYSFVATLRKMAKNSRMSKLSEKADECVFTWKLFTGWDYMIGNPETAHNRTASIVLGFKEALLEEREKVKDARNWKLISLRALVNLFVLGLLGGSCWAVVEMVRRSEEETDSWWRQNEVSIVLSLITYLFPTLFELLGLLEQYHPRKQLRLQLARIMVLNLMNLYALMLALFGKITKMHEELQRYTTTAAPTTTLPITIPITQIPSTDLTTAILSIAAINMTTIIFTNNTICQRIRVQIECGLTTSLPSSRSIMSSTIPKSLKITTENDLITLLGFTSTSSSTQSLVTDIGDDDNEITTTESSIPTTTNASDIYWGYQDDEPQHDDPNQSNFNPLSFFTQMLINPIKMAYKTAASTNLTVTDENATTIESITTMNDIGNITTIDENITTINENITTIEYDDNITTIENNDLLNDSVSTTTIIEEEQSEKCYEWKIYCPNSMSSTTSLYDEEDIETTTQQQYTTQDDGCYDHKPVEVTPAPTASPEELETRKNLRRLCWETMFGQELVKLTVMDLVMTVATVLLIDFIRAVFVRLMNHCWCWDLEKKFPQYGDFKIAENILQLVHNQGMVWMGMFFSPGLPALNLIKLVVIMYLRSWAVLTCNVPHEILFRASRSNNFYLALLLTMLFLCVLPVSYAIVRLHPSWHCGPFSNYNHTSDILIESIKAATPEKLHTALAYMASPGIVIPLLVLLMLIIYYLMSLTSALREANADLKVQLRQERTEERRKMFQLVDRRTAGGEATDVGNDNLLSRWRKILPVMPKPPSMAVAAAALVGSKIQTENTNKDPNTVNTTPAQKLVAAVLMKHRKDVAMKKQQKKKDDEEIGEYTDGDQQSLPDDVVMTSRGSLKHQSSTTSSTARADIPVITISKTESQDKLLDDPSTTVPTESDPAVPPPATASVENETSKNKETTSGTQKAEPQQPLSPRHIQKDEEIKK